MEWIKVEDRLPEFDAPILAVNIKSSIINILIATLVEVRHGKDYKFPRFTNEDCNTCEVTHWMPLPEPPTQ